MNSDQQLLQPSNPLNAIEPKKLKKTTQFSLVKETKVKENK